MFYSKANVATPKVDPHLQKALVPDWVSEEDLSILSFCPLAATHHNCARTLLPSLLLTCSPFTSVSRLAHYCRLRDVQTLAMLCSVFEAQSRPQGIPNPFGSFPSRSSNLVVSHSRYVSAWFSGLCLTFPKGKRHGGRSSDAAPVCSAAQLYVLRFLLQHVGPRPQYRWLEHR